MTTIFHAKHRTAARELLPPCGIAHALSLGRAASPGCGNPLALASDVAAFPTKTQCRVCAVLFASAPYESYQTVRAQVIDDSPGAASAFFASLQDHIALSDAAILDDGQRMELRRVCNQANTDASTVPHTRGALFRAARALISKGAPMIRTITCRSSKSASLVTARKTAWFNNLNQSMNGSYY